jgi:hypothetical protein
MKNADSPTQDMEWTYTPETEALKEVPWSGDVVVTVIEVCLDHRSGQYVSGLTHYRTPKDYEFHPRTFHASLEDAILRADSWARETAFDTSR